MNSEILLSSCLRRPHQEIKNQWDNKDSKTRVPQEAEEALVAEVVPEAEEVALEAEVAASVEAEVHQEVVVSEDEAVASEEAEVDEILMSL